MATVKEEKPVVTSSTDKTLARVNREAYSKKSVKSEKDVEREVRFPSKTITKQIKETTYKNGVVKRRLVQILKDGKPLSRPVPKGA